MKKKHLTWLWCSCANLISICFPLFILFGRAPIIVCVPIRLLSFRPFAQFRRVVHMIRCGLIAWNSHLVLVFYRSLTDEKKKHRNNGLQLQWFSAYTWEMLLCVVYGWIWKINKSDVLLFVCVCVCFLNRSHVFHIHNHFHMNHLHTELFKLEWLEFL